MVRITITTYINSVHRTGSGPFSRRFSAIIKAMSKQFFIDSLVNAGGYE